MDGFKDSTKTKFGAHGSACYARGGAVKKAVAAFKKADAVQDAKLVAKAVKSVQQEPVKKSLGGLIKKVSPLAALASGDDSGIGGALKALSPAAMLLAKKKKNPVEDISVTQVSAQPTQMKRGGKVRGGLSFNSKPLIGK